MPDPCRCFFLLERAFDSPEGPITLDMRNPQWIGYGSITLVMPGTTNYGLNFCPWCGGRLGSHKPELVAAYQRYRAALSRYSQALGAARDTETAARLARATGATETVSTGTGLYDANVWRDPENSLEVTAQFDADHMRVYATCSFSPSAALKKEPFTRA